LPNSQVKGLLNIAKASQYNELERYIEHQRQRDWNAKSRYLKTFYTELEKVLTAMKNKRLRQEFQLLTTPLTHIERIREADELMAQLAYEFIQHLLAENALLIAEMGTGRVKNQRAGSKLVVESGAEKVTNQRAGSKR
jgi:predicted AAA+ superfamily ATPase